MKKNIIKFAFLAILAISSLNLFGMQEKPVKDTSVLNAEKKWALVKEASNLYKQFIVNKIKNMNMFEPDEIEALRNAREKFFPLIQNIKTKQDYENVCKEILNYIKTT